MSDVTKLAELYLQTSKHSQYQILPNQIAVMMKENHCELPDGKTRFEAERLAYLLKNIDVSNRIVLDIGGNTGFFTFEILNNGANHLTYYEGNPTHAEFVRTAASLLSLSQNIDVFPEYFDFTSKKSQVYDVCLCLNVLHHLGDDFDNPSISMEHAKQMILCNVNHLAPCVRVLALQIGFNWKGKRDLCLFESGTKSELIDFIQKGTNKYWTIQSIGIAEQTEAKVVYKEMSRDNLPRKDALGEFLNRPIFIMRSKCAKQTEGVNA